MFKPVPFVLATVLAGSVSPAIAAAPAPRGVAYETVAPMNATVEQRILPELDVLMGKLLAEKRNMTLDGVKVFEADDKFLPGKIAIGLSYLLLDTPRDDPRFRRYLAGFREIADMTVEEKNDTWGVYYYIQALHMLKEAGLLDDAVSAQTRARLRAKLDWRHFVRSDDLTLIDLPNNYYGVAFSVARLRYQMGWEDASASEALLARMLDHYRKYSGEYGFADETDGDGRFDRYSVLLIGEIAHRFIESGIPATPELKGWLRKSVDMMLPRFNRYGEGFEYGRSIGAYGETAFLEVMTAAAVLGVLTDEEKEMAYAFSSRVTARYADFWFDPKMGSVDMWENGRRTDAYRGKHRILGENLSLARQHIYTSRIWDEQGFRNKAPSPRFDAWLKSLPERQTTWFARGGYDRFVVTFRDGDHVLSLPVINGGTGQHMHSPYFPVPFSAGMLSGVADGDAPNLLPRFTLSDGVQLMPLAYFKDAKVTVAGKTTTITWRQDQVDRMGDKAPRPDDRLSVRTTYVFSPGKIVRTDLYTPKAPLALGAIDLELGTYSAEPSWTGQGFAFGAGDVTGFAATGLDGCEARPFESAADAGTPPGPMKTRLVCTSGPRTVSSPFSISWTLTYR
ncbi:hypothetical protein P7B02_02185 [Caulobacter segnis]|uniref:hypothetical protein n=1 Tax=Caulobacter segnis TaxID=88688 RepID=UPI00240F00A1|nr:hypothetical protein [Caulobacter segnis]MDG2520335.1 hypothetical protein [Caulobacter segnis]